MLPVNSKKAGVISCFWCRVYDPICAGKLVEELAIVETTQWTVRVGLECAGMYCVWLDAQRQLHVLYLCVFSDLQNSFYAHSCSADLLTKPVYSVYLILR